MIPQIYYPGWTKKAMTFTIDDGNVPLDRKFLQIVNPAGLRGTFNLCSNLLSDLSAAGYRQLYRGHGIANHAKYHVSAKKDGVEYHLSDLPKPAVEPDKQTLYFSGVPGLRIGWICADYWDYVAESPEEYMRFVAQGQAELESVFGKGGVRGFVYPNGRQKNQQVNALLYKTDYDGLRVTGCVRDTTGYHLPQGPSPIEWSYNADCMCLLEEAKKYEAVPDDEQLRFFSFGVHSADFERANKWDDLRVFCSRYGNRPTDYYYAPVSEIFSYVHAAKCLKITGNILCNPTNTDLYILRLGSRFILRAGEKIDF